MAPKEGNCKQLHFGGSKVGCWVYNTQKPGAKMEILVEMGHFRVLLYREEPELAPPGPPQSFGMGK
jgi:hypothetical protein